MINITPHAIMTALPADWPILLSNGHITIVPSRGMPPSVWRLEDQLMLKFSLSPKQAQQAVVILDNYVTELNAKADHIRTTTKVTSHPQILMSLPRWPVFEDVLKWHVLKQQLEASGAQVENAATTPQAQHNDFEIWTRDRYVMARNGTAIFSRPPTQREVTKASYITGAEAASHHLQTFFQERGVKTHQLDAYFAGGDVLQHPQSNTVFVGIKMDKDGTLNATKLQDAELLAATLGMRLAAIPKIKYDPYYHLDTFMAVLPDGGVVILPDATNAAGMQVIRSTVSAADILELPLTGNEDNRTLATNLITVNGNSFTANALPALTQFLKNRGLRAVTGPYRISDSGVHCITNILVPDPSDGRNNVAMNMVMHGLPKVMAKMRG